MSEQEFVDSLMLDLLEDSLALWEVEALGRKELEHLPEAQRGERARALINKYLNRGWIDIFERQVTYLPGNNAEFGPLIPLEPARIAGILSDDSLWDYDAIGDAPSRFFIRMNERGRTEFREDARRRGLFRS